MTIDQDTVLRLARKAGITVTEHGRSHEQLLRIISKFAKLVAEHEREACAKVCDAIDKSHWGCEVKASWCSDSIRARGEA